MAYVYINMYVCANFELLTHKEKGTILAKS